MSLRRAVAAPFRQRGVEQLPENKFVVALSLDLDWFTADQATRLVDIAEGEGLLAREGEDIVATFDPREVDVPDDFAPDEAILQERTTFERVLDQLIDAGVEKQQAVAAINKLQADLAITIEAAAVLYARQQGLEVTGVARAAREELDG